MDPLPSGSVFLEIEATWWSPAPRSDLLPQLVSGGVRTVAVVNDVMPMSNPDWFDPRNVRRFSAWMRAHVDAGSTLVASS